VSIPAYLQKIETADYYYGELRYEKKTDSWVIEGEPCVVEAAKRIFPGSSGKGAGLARFKNTKRINGDLNWLMQRYPLKVPDKWEQSYQEAVDHVVKRQELNRQPQKVIPPLEFIGQLLEYQKEGLAFLCHNRRTLLADEMGTGKTPCAIAFLSMTESYPALLVVPPHLIRNWQKELDKFVRLPKKVISMFDDNKDQIHVIKGLKPYKLPEASVYIIHYLLLRGWKNILPDMEFKAVIFDEIQELRHSGTDKYSAASLVASGCENVIGLSGTPIYNRGGEIWNVINILEYHCLGDWDSFTREWCSGYGTDVVMKPELLNDYLKREGLMLRRRKVDVLKELPPKRRVIQMIDFDTGTYGKLIQAAVEKAKSINGISDYFEKGRLTRDIVNDSRQAIGIAKAPYVAAFVKMLLEAGEKVLLFAYHHAVHDIYTKELKEFNPVRITGHETGTEKEKSVEAFMGGKTNIVIISLRAGSGLNLQRATCTVTGELDWSPAVLSQCEDRCIAEGQLVYTKNNGLIPIENVEIGDEVISHTGQFKKVLGKMKRNHRGLVTSVNYFRYNNPLICTHDHKILVLRDCKDELEWVEASKILPRDFVVMPSYFCENDMEYIKMPEEIQHKNVSLTKGHLNGRFVNIPKKVKITDDLLFLFGWYLAEGFANLNDGKGKFISLSGHRKEIGILERLGTYITQEFGVSYSIRVEKNSAEMRAYSVDLARWFSFLFGTNGENMRVHQSIMALPKEKLQVLLDAYIEGDGYSRNKQKEYVSISKTLAYEMALVSIKCGKIPSLREVHNDINAGQWIGGFTENSNPDNKRLNKRDESFIYQPVSSVETYLDKITVYDLEVEDDHSFVVGQCVVHNCHRIGQEDSLLCYYLVAEEGTDEIMQEFLGFKISQFVGIMGDRPETEEDRMLAQGKATEHMNKIVEKLKGGKGHAESTKM